MGQGLLVVEAVRSHTDTPHSVVLLRTSDDLVAEISTSQHTAAKIDKHPRFGQDSNAQSQQASWGKPTTYTARPLDSTYLNYRRNYQPLKEANLHYLATTIR